VSTLTALARAQAVRAGRAQPLATVAHLHVHRRPLVLVPLALAGEAHAPLAALVGDHRDHPNLLVVAQPRNRDERFAFAADLAGEILPYLDRYASATEAVATGREVRYRFVEAPQVVVPNPGGVGFLRLLGRSLRFRRITGEHAVRPTVPLLGQWLTFLATAAEHPGSSLLVAATTALSRHWATGQSALEDNNLAALLGWIDPPPGRTGEQAAREAEDPAVWPPAGPTTDPGFDADVLQPLVERYDRAADGTARAAAARAVREALATQLTPTWNLVWRAVDQLRGLPPAATVPVRWAEDRDLFSDFVVRVQSGAPPQPRLDHAVAAAARLARLERALDRYEAQRAFDDPLVLAGYRLSGEAFAGQVSTVDAQRSVRRGKRRWPRPYVWLRTDDPVRLEPGRVVRAVSRPRQDAVVVSVTDGPDGTEVQLELTAGMGRGTTPDPDSLPCVGEHLCYTTLSDTWQPPGAFPDPERTPWTHGGPPQRAAEVAEPGEEWA
jgi:hypothetical protein